MKETEMSMDFSQAFPEMPANFCDNIDRALLLLDKKRTPEPSYRPIRIAAIACAALLLVSGCIFTVHPAFASGIPFVNEVVYTLSPEVTANEKVSVNIKEISAKVIKEFFSDSFGNIGQEFKSGNGWVENEDTLLAAYYLQYEGATVEILNNWKKPDVSDIELSNIKATEKAFRYNADISYDIVLDGRKARSETIHMALEDHPEGFVITGMSIENGDFDRYKGLITEYQKSNPGKALADGIANYNAFVIGQAMEDKVKEDKLVENQPSTKEGKIGNIAAALMYQFWNTKKTCDVPDISGLIERNENTELFYLAMDIQACMVKGGLLPRAVIVEKGYGDINDISEENGIITVCVWVRTKVDGSIGETLTLKLKPKDGGYIITSFEENGDGVWSSLKRMANKYNSKGYSKTESYKAAYREWADNIYARVKAIKKYMDEGFTSEEAKQKEQEDWASGKNRLN